MALLGSFICFVLISTVLAIPLQGQAGLHESFYGTTHSQRMKYPLYMMQLYQSLILGNGTDLSGLEQSVLLESDTVLSLLGKSCTEVGDHWMFSFDMSSISSNTELKLVELRVHLPSFGKKHKITVEIYHTKEGQIKHFLGSFRTNPSATKGDSWKIFNLTTFLQNSINQGASVSHGEYIVAENMSRLSSLAGHQLRQRNIDPLSRNYFPAERVMLVVFARDKPSASHFGSFNLIKTVQSSKYIMTEKITKVAGLQRQRRNHKTIHSIVLNSIPSKAVEAGTPLCRRVDMWVEFDKIEWGNRIVYPRSYNAYRCEGACPIPLNENFKPTNHAFIKSLLKLNHAEKVECSSCVPVKMRALSMLIYEEDEVTSKHHEEMVVETCGCS
ncbi:nodal homolog 2-A-like [Mixophyes fleayi]|uniref:nodal homolog 2-A-like n=1 Tax=Mixophyes fleayi TaxID=3061075 RepID=UPI003F4D7641